MFNYVSKFGLVRTVRCAPFLAEVVGAQNCFVDEGGHKHFNKNRWSGPDPRVRFGGLPCLTYPFGEQGRTEQPLHPIFSGKLFA